jgi:hypothetical protein
MIDRSRLIPKPPHPRRCELCEHWEPAENPNIETGQCTHELPNVVMLPIGPGQMSAVTYFPQTKPLERCGKWEAKKPAIN